VEKPRRVSAKVEWHPGELYPRVGFVVTNLARPAMRVVALYNQRGTCEQRIKEGRGAIKWTRLSCRSFPNAVRLQLHALAYNLANFMRTLASAAADVPGDPVAHCPVAGDARTSVRGPGSIATGNEGCSAP
jgi:Transposase DDE domain group 1